MVVSAPLEDPRKSFRKNFLLQLKFYCIFILVGDTEQSRTTKCLFLETTTK